MTFPRGTSSWHETSETSETVGYLSVLRSFGGYLPRLYIIQGANLFGDSLTISVGIQCRAEAYRRTHVPDYVSAEHELPFEPHFLPQFPRALASGHRAEDARGNLII